MKLEEIKELVQHFENRKWKKIHLKKGDFELHLEKEGEAVIEEVPQRALPVEERKITPKEGVYVKSPMVGTFYASPSPDQPPFVKVGDRVDEKTVVCIIEAMKVMNEVKAGKKGMIAEILVESSQPVEFGSKLFRIV